MTQRTHTETVLTAPEDKPGFVVYYSIYEEVIKKLDDHQIANLFRAMLSTGGVCEMPTLDPLTDMAFGPILRGMKENDERWLKTKYARAENGRKGGLQRAKNERKRKEAEAKASTLENVQAPSCTLEANQANQAVNVTVTVTVNGTGIVNVIDYPLLVQSALPGCGRSAQGAPFAQLSLRRVGVLQTNVRSFSGEVWQSLAKSSKL